MTIEEKYAGAILALKMIAKTKPHQKDYESRKMIDIATSALEELLKESEYD